MAAGRNSRVSTAKFDAFVGALVHDLNKDVGVKTVKALGLKFLDMVMNAGTEGVTVPVKTGRARAGFAAFADAEGVPVGDVGSDQAEIEKGRKEGSYEFNEAGQKSAYLGIHNAVPYIIYLEYGHSDKAPGGFVRITLERIRLGVKEEALERLRDKMASANAKARATQLVFKVGKN